MRTIAFFLALTLFCPLIAAQAAPTISGVSGTMDDGQTVTISGSSFGSHDLALQWLGGPDGAIEQGTIGQMPTKSGWTFGGGGWDENYVTTEYARSGSKCLKDVLTTSAPIRYGWPSNIGPHTYIYVSWWVRRVHTGSGQWKMFRINWQNDITDDYPQIVMFNWDSSPQHFVRPGPSISANNTQDWAPLFPKSDSRWYRMDYIVYTSAVGANDGWYMSNLADPTGGAAIKTKTLGNAMSFYDSSRYYRWFLWQNYYGNGVTAQQTWTDDIYVQVGTQARVELGDNATFSQCTFREMQKPTAWASGQIQISLNKGGFKTGDTAYLFVVDGNGEASAGRQITIGESASGGTTTPPVDNAPSVSITTPTSSSTYSTTSSSINLAGAASDDNGISSVTWSNSQGGSGTATYSSGSWSVSGVTLQSGTNVITVTAHDTAGQTATDTLSIDYSTSSSGDTGTTTPDDSAWNADSNIGGGQWYNSSVTYCVRILIPGSQITQSGNTIKLGFQGRSSGSYQIRAVSIAQRDTSSSTGNVVDATWKKVTFDKKGEVYYDNLAGDSWENYNVTVPQGTEKVSNPIPFNIQQGQDYYVTFKIVTPAVYQNPPSGYSELYFSSADHTQDLDWAGTGYATTQDYHALSNIYITNGLVSPSMQ